MIACLIKYSMIPYITWLMPNPILILLLSLWLRGSLTIVLQIYSKTSMINFLIAKDSITKK